MNRRAFLGAAAGVTAVFAGCTGQSRQEGDDEIGMSSSAFLQPENFEPRVGEAVVWRNTGSRTHTVTAYESGIPDGATFFASGGFESTKAARDAWLQRGGGGIASGETFEVTFEVPGTYNYFCIPHERGGMVAQFTVVE
ncbi:MULTISPECIES: plastocyanin/azurin family copper-binding protein [Halococcus]|uniref:Blue (Type 1) copper domain-containing protein n=1 Tax=Halococcus salifodinae DSM 8989 TaxID=1227456 RepID=M0N2D8_9EURY|nr:MULTISPECIES: plastocyanin/azurin family copper-binding protein [Halococcus]EMA50875.1 blue (type 1) copper domain-containing protein [Halococcus salifodinae DSM 8989]